MIRVNALTKKIGSFVAVDGLSFDCAAGEVIGLLAQTVLANRPP